MTSLADILAEPDASKVPLFPVEPPDGHKHLSEIKRCVSFRKSMILLSPAFVFAIPNAGKRNPMQASQEGIVGGVFDYHVAWNHGGAWLEFKGYSAAGRPGKLSPAQIDWGNRMQALGKSVACFFDPMHAIEWLHSVGCPIRATL